MDKRELLMIIDDVLKPHGFKKKGNNWFLENLDLTKRVNLQKSQFSNSYYINYGYIINSLPLKNSMMHVFRGFSSRSKKENILIQKLLDLQSKVSNETRKTVLTRLLNENLLSEFQKVNTEEELFNDLKNQKNLNDIFLDVRNYFGLSNT